MKQMKTTALILSTALLMSGCGTMNNTTKGGIIGGGGGTAAGALIGGLIGKGKGAAIGAAIGAVVGTSAGVVIGKKMDKKAEEAAKIEGAQVEMVQDKNGLIRNNYFDRIMKNVMADFNSLIGYWDD